MAIDDGRGKILEYPEKWDEMVKKHEERAKEQLEKVLQSRKAETIEELKKLAQRRLVSKRERQQDIRPVKDRTILVEASSPEIKSLREELNRQISSFARARLKPSEAIEIPEGLKGRVTSQKDLKQDSEQEE
jgi:hypothetical protein